MRLSKQFKQDLLVTFEILLYFSGLICFCISIGGLLYQLEIGIGSSMVMFFFVGFVFLTLLTLILTILSYILIGILKFISYAIEKD